MSPTGRPHSLHAQVLEVLGTRIVHGIAVPGTVLSFDELENEFGASRTALREALKVLGAKGLVGARPRHGTYVLPRDRWNLLDLDVMRWRGSGPSDLNLLVDLNQLRQILEPGAAELAATNRSEDQLEQIFTALEGLRVDGTIDHEFHINSDIAFHVSILEATGNELLSSLRVILEPALRVRNRLVFQVSTEDPHDAHAAVAFAIRDQDPTRARSAMSALISNAAASVAEATAHPATDSFD